MTPMAAYFSLTKPRLLPLVLLSGLPGLLLAAGTWPDSTLIVATLVGTGLAAGAANALNSYLERESDARMERTRARPLPAGALDPSRALAFGLVLAVVGTCLLWVGASKVAAGLALAAILFYVFVYTLWLKPRHPIAVVVGGFSGAIAPLIADAAVRGTVGLSGLLLFGIIFVWQPPHFWAIALYRREDYARAGFPLLPERVGAEATRRRIIAWVAALIPLTLVPVATSGLGIFYGTVAALLGGWFMWSAIRLYRQRTNEAARRLFRVSLFYLAGLFLAMLLELVVTVGRST
jgi:protoheme IX farnesyltransferase